MQLHECNTTDIRTMQGPAADGSYEKCHAGTRVSARVYMSVCICMYVCVCVCVCVCDACVGELDIFNDIPPPG